MKLAKLVLNPEVVDNAAAAGATPETVALITEAVEVLKGREAARIEHLREQIADYDAFVAATTPPQFDPEPEATEPKKTTRKERA